MRTTCQDTRNAVQYLARTGRSTPAGIQRLTGLPLRIVLRHLADLERNGEIQRDGKLYRLGRVRFDGERPDLVMTEPPPARKARGPQAAMSFE